MCYRGIPSRGITAPSLSFEEVAAPPPVLPPLRGVFDEARHRVFSFSRARAREKERKTDEGAREGGREENRARGFSLNRVTSRAKEYRLMTGCTLDSDIAPFLAIRPAIKTPTSMSLKRASPAIFLSLSLSLSFFFSFLFLLISPSPCLSCLPASADSVTRS